MNNIRSREGHFPSPVDTKNLPNTTSKESSLKDSAKLTIFLMAVVTAVSSFFYGRDQATPLQSLPAADFNNTAPAPEFAATPLGINIPEHLPVVTPEAVPPAPLSK